MTLLQISDPARRTTAVGIDLGTTHSLVGYVTATGEPIAITDCDNEALVPSVVHYGHDGSVTVGSEAVRAMAHASQDTIASVKRLMGRSPRDRAALEAFPYRFSDGDDGVVRMDVAGGRRVTPVEVSAEILRALKQRAEAAVGTLGGVVITVPAYFDDAQRQATKDAGQLAGLEVLRLLNEPTAAALAYGLASKQNGRFAVYDLGGGTFDVTVLDLDNGVFQVRATGGDSHLGGDDMDLALALMLARELNLGETWRGDAGLQRQLLTHARAIKHRLTEVTEVTAEVKTEAGVRLVTVTRQDFEHAISDVISRTGAVSERVLRDAGVTAAQLDGVVLVGGATRVPAVRAFVEVLFGQPPLTSVDPDQVVALGAAVQADLLAGDAAQGDVLLIDVLPLSLGIEAMGGVVERILPRNTPIPAEATQTFTTYADNQTGFDLHVVQGERETAEHCRSLARFTLRGIPPMVAGAARLQVKFLVDANGLLTVSAEELTTGVAQHIDIKPSYGLGSDEIERLLLDSMAHGEADVAERNLREQRVEAGRVTDALARAMAEDAALLEGDEQARLTRLLSSLAVATRGTDHRQIQAAISDLEHASHAFAGRRMDRSMRAVLAGKSAAEVERATAHARGTEGHG